MDIKQQLFNECRTFVEKRLKTIEEIISSNQKALQSETKSSAGDKHETGRAMLQLEMEKASQQLASVSLFNETLSKIDISKNAEFACLGSIIYTNHANYFLSISAGQISIKNTNFFAISVSSPIGKLVLGKKEKESFNFNGKSIFISRLA